METVSLEVAKKLKDYLPENFDSEFYWALNTEGKGYIHNDPDFLYGHQGKLIPAPTLCEMLKLLPAKVKNKHDVEYYFELQKGLVGYHDSPFTHWMNKGRVDVTGKTNLATAAAELYMWYKDNMGGAE